MIELTPETRNICGPFWFSAASRTCQQCGRLPGGLADQRAGSIGALLLLCGGATGALHRRDVLNDAFDVNSIDSIAASGRFFRRDFGGDVWGYGFRGWALGWC